MDIPEPERMCLDLRTEYWDDARARAAFKTFISNIHGLDFSAWDEGGFWDPAYTPFSFFRGDTVVSSVCIYLLDVVINGEKTCLAQISGVGTLPGWRRRGLSRELTELGLAWARNKHNGVFLFADADAVPYYGRCGFSPIDEFIETTQVTPVPNCGGLIKLDPGLPQDLEMIHEYAKRRTSVSDRFGVLNDKLLMFHVLYRLRDRIYRIPDLDCLVSYARTGDKLSIFDIVAENMPRFEKLYPYLASADDRIVEFHFSTDKLELLKPQRKPLTGNNPMIRGAFPVEAPVFPYSSRA